jgi:hypothetical protein
MLVLRFPWQATTCVGALVAAYALLTGNSAEIPLDREGVAKQERNPAHPQLLRAATFCVPLSGALFLVSCMITFVTFMNAREQWQRESAGSYHTSSFRVLQSYWEKRSPAAATRRVHFSEAWRKVTRNGWIWCRTSVSFPRMKKQYYGSFRREPSSPFTTTLDFRATTG